MIENRITNIWHRYKGYAISFDRDAIKASLLKIAQGLNKPGFMHHVAADSIFKKINGSATDDSIAEHLTDVVIFALNNKVEFLSTNHYPNLSVIRDCVVGALRDFGFYSVADAAAIHYNSSDAIEKGWISQKQSVGNGFPFQYMKKLRSKYERNGIATIEDLNRVVKDGGLLKLVQADTRRYERFLRETVKKFQAKCKLYPKMKKMIIVGGPSSSSKTTIAFKIAEMLRKMKYKARVIGGDNYFRGTQPVNTYGQNVYETPLSLHIHAMIEDVNGLYSGKPVHHRIYDFVTKESKFSEEAMVLEEDEIVIFDSFIGLYSPIRDGFSKDIMTFSIYVEAYTGFCNENIRFTDVRVLRRLNRDIGKQNRGWSFDGTFGYLPVIRSGELKYIIPYYNTADTVFDGGLMYDLPVLFFALAQHPEFSLEQLQGTFEKFKAQGRLDAYKRAQKLLKIMPQIELPTMEEVGKIPKNNLIREFIHDLGL